jgi:predicted RecB family nuclease
MLITEEVFSAFLKCETKSYLKLSGTVGDNCEFDDWDRRRVEDFKQQFWTHLRSNYREDEYLIGSPLTQALENKRCRLVFDCVVQTPEMQSRIHILERPPSAGKTKYNPYIPIRFNSREKITPHDKLLLAFDALVLSVATGQAPPFGKIIYGSKYSVANVKLEELTKSAQAVVGKIKAQQTDQTPLQLVLNKHCPECEFKTHCRQTALEEDNLSLLAGMSVTEIKKHNSRGIFSVAQLSYTYRARRRPKRFAAKPEQSSHALRALAIRERKIHISGKPELKIHGNPVYLDVEGIPNQDFYYLIGLRVRQSETTIQYSFWANDSLEEKQAWTAFLQTMLDVENPQLIHYGSYETTFLKRMKERHGVAAENSAFLDRLITESVNILSIIYAHIYFPTYSNSLKEVAQFLGFRWTEAEASGLRSLIWRSEWELLRDAAIKHKLITYNAEDCEALENIVSTVAQLCQKQADPAKSLDSSIVHTDSLKRDDPLRFGKKEFALPEFQQINKAAYWDYQRDRIYARTNPRLKRVSKKRKVRIKTFPVNTIVECQAPTNCPLCNASTIRRHGSVSKTAFDLKFGQSGVKRWVVKYVYYRHYCYQCKKSFSIPPGKWKGRKYGPDFVAYLIYQLIELRLPTNAVGQHVEQLFGFHLTSPDVHREKSRASHLYKDTAEAILKKLVAGKLIHADETKVSVKGKGAYVWVFTSLEEVLYYYTPTREGEFLQEKLRRFNGVLVSDFYAAYDSLNCPQQKCLIHLMRDLNDDLLKAPFNEELKTLVHEFALLLKPMVETVDRYGLKAHFLRKHKVFVERFYKNLSKCNYSTDIAAHYKKRFEKNRNTLFTFLDYDSVPWNNNNAEHAIKAFARLRDVLGGMSTEKGIREYLIFLSISETCKYKGVSFLDFLRSGKKEIDEFINSKAKSVSQPRKLRSKFIMSRIP